MAFCLYNIAFFLIVTFLKGLNLELNIQQDEYIGAFTEEAGVRVDITNQGEMAFPRERGLSAAPGFATSVGMRKVSVIRFWRHAVELKIVRCYMASSVSRQDGAILPARDYPPCPARKISPKAIK